MNPHGPDPIAQEIEEAYAAHGTALFRFALRLCGSRDDAEDRRYVVALDSKTSLPRNVRLERNLKGRWVSAKQSIIPDR